MSVEFVALGGALDPTGKLPPIGGDAKLFVAGKKGLLFDFGALPNDKKSRRAQSEAILSVGPNLEYIKPGGLMVPVLPDISEEILKGADLEFQSVGGKLAPNIGRMKELEELWVVATHGHADHVGLLPYLKRIFPHARVMMTAPTAAISKWSWHDHLAVLRRQNQRRPRSRRVQPLFTEADIESLLDDVKLVKFGDVVHCGPFELKFLFNPHMLGAVSVLMKISAPDGKIIEGFLTGDIRYKHQGLIPGIPIPTLQGLSVDHLDFLVLESTYGGKTLPPAEAEEARLAADIEKCCDNGGKFLIASLAIDRAQKLFDALVRHGVTEHWPVWIDGAAREISGIYKTHLPGESGLASVQEHFVLDNDHRREILFSPEPLVMIASSGMLVGGPSVFYASHWAEDEKNVIATASWQDPESAGGKLSHIRRGQRVEFCGRKIRFNAATENYRPSSHIEGEEAVATIASLRPEKTFLVHGEESAMDAICAKSPAPTIKTIVNKPYRL